MSTELNFDHAPAVLPVLALRGKEVYLSAERSHE